MKNTEQDLQAKAQRKLANPDFDVIEFVNQVNEHFANPQIIKTLSSDSMILMSILDNGSFNYLEANPEYVSPETFRSYSDQGFETWVKKSVNGSKISWWYGVYLDNISIGLTWKRIYGSSWKPKFSLSVSKEPKLKALRSRWKKYKMLQIGEDPGVKKVNPIYKIRKQLIEKLNKIGYEGKYRRNLKPTEAHIRAENRKITLSVTSGWYKNHPEVNFKVKALSFKNLEVSLSIRDVSKELTLNGVDDGEIVNGAHMWKLYCKKFDMSRPDIVDAILNHLKTKSVKHSHLP